MQQLRSSGPQKLPPKALTDPYVKLSLSSNHLYILQTPNVQTVRVTGKSLLYHEIKDSLVDGKMNAERFIVFLKRLQHNASEPIFLILDGHPVHKFKRVT